jgi:DNA-binding NarL/FixJ family response regulator
LAATSTSATRFRANHEHRAVTNALLTRDFQNHRTERREVLRLVASGLTSNEIATELFLSPKTVSRHRWNTFTKVGVSSRASATAFAVEHYLLARSGGSR